MPDLNSAPSPTGWQLYKRLLGYVKSFWLAFLISVFGYFLFAASTAATAKWLQLTVDAIQGIDGNELVPMRVIVDEIESLAEAHGADFLELDELLLHLDGLGSVEDDVLMPASTGFWNSIENLSARIDDLVMQSPRLTIPILAVFIALVRGLGGFLGGYFMALVANNVVHTLRSEIIAKLLRLPSRFYDKNSSGHLISKVTYDVAQLNRACANASTVFLREGFTVVYLLSYLFYLDWKLTSVFLLVAPFIFWVVFFVSKKFRRYSQKMQGSMGEVTHITNETVKGYRTIRIFAAEQNVNQSFVDASERNLNQNMKMILARTLSTPVIQCLVAMAVGALVWFAMDPVRLVEMTTGQFVLFITLAALLAKPIRQLSNVNSDIQKGIAACNSVFGLLDEDNEIDFGTYTIPRAKGLIEFRNVSFSYDETSKNALDAISFRVPAGSTVALVGVSGSGKSTLVSLLPRFYDIGSGEILLDGKNLREYTLQNLRQHISIVTQQVVLFSGTVAENIAYGLSSSVPEREIIRVAKNAHAMEFIQDMEKGLHTHVGDDASLLSGGQRQRIAIARAFLKDSPILIFDEATSALDSVSERYIQDALRTLMKGRTTLVIAHRLSTIENADLILVMSEGKIVESGKHSELLAVNRHYAKLYTVQFSQQVKAEQL